MAGLVTKETNRSVENFIANIGNPSKENDCKVLLELMTDATGSKPKVWGNNKVPDFLIGYGKYKYSRKNSKEEFEWFRVGFAARKTKLTIYLTFDISQEKSLLSKLGKCKWGRGCLYVNKLDDIDQDVLRQLVEKSRLVDND